MKYSKSHKYSSLLLIILCSFAFATNGQETVTISGTKFTYPLIEKWIAEYTKIHSDVKIKLVQKSKTAQEADLNIIAHQPAKEELKDSQDIIYAGRYALLQPQIVIIEFWQPFLKKA